MPDETPSTETTDEKPPVANHVDGKTMHVKIHAPFKVYFDGEAESISAINPTGPFDILAKHHHFMTLLSQGDIIVRTGGGNEEKIPITRGIMHVKKDEIIVFLDV
jgi:F0F1-type ATP synthase epsilon subunit